jgi:hypothetical protein
MSEEQSPEPGVQPVEPWTLPASDMEPGRVIRVTEGRGYITHVNTRKGKDGQDALVMLRYVANDQNYSVSHLATEEIEVLL